MDDDSDETEGRRLYRARADALARAQINYGKRRVRLGDKMSVTSVEDVVKHDAMIDLAEAEIVEFVTHPDGRVWVNVDGVCCLRVKRAKIAHAAQVKKLSEALASKK